MTIARKIHGGLVAMAAVVALTAWGIGLMSGDLTSLDRTGASILFLVELPFLTFWLVPGNATIRLGVLVSVLVAVDAIRVHVLALNDAMVLAGAWPWLVGVIAAWLLNEARRKATRPPDRARDNDPGRAVLDPAIP